MDSKKNIKSESKLEPAFSFIEPVHTDENAVSKLTDMKHIARDICQAEKKTCAFLKDLVPVKKQRRTPTKTMILPGNSRKSLQLIPIQKELDKVPHGKKISK